MTKNKWTVRLILLVTIILAGIMILINIKSNNDNIHISKIGLDTNILTAGEEDEDLYWNNDNAFDVTSIQGGGCIIPNIPGRAIK